MAWWRSPKSGLQWLGAWLRENRIVAVIAGLWIAFVPAGWAVVPGWAQWDGRIRAFVLATWGVAAFLIVVATAHQARQVEALMGEAQGARDEERRAAGLTGLRLLLRHRCTGLRPYDLQLFLLDEAGRRLYAAASSDDVPSDTTWEIGRGATGYAYLTGDRVIARGSVVSDATYGLSPVEQERYRGKDIEIVAAMPVKNSVDRTIGVLTASGATDDGYFNTDLAYNEQLELALAVAQMIINLCRWEADT